MDRQAQEKSGEPRLQTPSGEGNMRSPSGTVDAQADERFRVFAETAADAILVIDEASTIHFANPAAGGIFGYAPGELEGQNLTLLMPEYLRHLHSAGLHSYVETGVRHISWRGVELPGLRRDGREIELEISFGEFTRGGRRFFTGIARDISGRKRAERRLAAQHAVTRVLAEAGELGATTLGILRAVCENLKWDAGEFWSLDKESGVLRYAESWRAAEFPEFDSQTRSRTFGRGEGLPGRVWETGATAWIDDVTRDPNFPRAAAAAREGIRAGFAFPVRASTELIGVMEFFALETRPPDAALEALMSSIGGQLGQLVERRRAEESLRRAEEGQRFLAEASALLSASLDYETTLQSIARLVVPYLSDWCIIDLLVDETIERVAVAHEDPERVALAWETARRVPLDRRGLAGVPKVISTGRAEFFPQVTDELISSAYVEPELREVVRRLSIRSAMIVPMSCNERTLGAISFATAESGRRYIEADLALASDLAHRAALAVENARLYREAQEVNRLKDEFLATLSHELRTPLTSILGWAGLLRTVALDGETASVALATIERNARSQKQLIDDLLDASRIITGKLRVDARPTELSQVVEAAVSSVRPAAAAKGVELRFAAPPESSLVMGDAERLQQVVWNLLSNAVKFTPEGGRITVKLAHDGKRARIFVSDTGVGIPTEFLPHVFERFRQADASTTRAYGGLGLGLSIVRSLVELHGGAVRAESEGEGRGATFTISLPLARLPDRERVADRSGGVMEAVSSDAGARRQGTLDSLRVLLVDDDPDTLAMLEKTLERYGARVTARASAAEALSAFEPGAFDVLVSDIGMPEEDGFTLLRRLREREASATHLPALALTAYAREEDREKALAAGFRKHLAKPIAPAELVEALASLTSPQTKDEG